MEQRAGHCLGAGADVEKDRAAVRDVFGTGAGDARLSLFMQVAPLGIADVTGPRGQYRAAVHPLQLAAIGQFGEVTADGLMGDAEMFGQPIDGDFAFASGDFKNVGMAECL